MRYLGVDYGKKRVGLALSDESGWMAFPHSVIPGGGDIAERISLLGKKERVNAVVLGESYNYKNQPNPIMKDILELKRALEAGGSTVFLHPEMLTSQEAKHIQGENTMHDASAATLILQSYIDQTSDKNSREQ